MATARDLMTTPAEYLNDEDTLVVAAQALREANVGSMPVRDASGRLVGVVTDRDLVVRGLAEGKNPATTAVSDVCTGSVVTVMVDDDADTVASVLGENQIRRVPVVDGEELVGIVSQADIARHLPEQQTGDVVQRISQ
ncbi:CBS domain-containing protein [Intrasporangium sp.]|uniref:CBS domain-containing protein n=1 Tax=Intrasporangium sp. TaxID=1925024 RepID=UPI00293B53AA|nr:CBS domain-containing protein [Intrasporangium sp.]MDV3220894.1 CBS domain-containing protein [Intrasporangium sp.]